MKRKKASFIINPRAGQNLSQLSAILAVFAAAGWKTDLALKEYGGHAMVLATDAAEHKCDCVIAYGGDGTLNQVVNGVMHAQNHHSVVGLIPGGTANVWANEIGVPDNPVEAALALINSEARQVDLGHLAVEGLTLPEAAQDEQSQRGKKERQKRGKAGKAKARQHFLLMAGLGIDAAIMGHVSKPLKYRVGALAVGASTAKELPAHKPFPVEIRAGDEDNGGIHWKGEALQVVIGNTRLYADIVEMTPDAHIDDGILDVCVITAGNPLTTMQQIASLLLRHHPDNLTAEYFQGAHFSLSVPASVALQLDGSARKLKDYLSKTERRTLSHVDEPEQVMVTYRFDAMPRALQIAVPRTYKGVLFEGQEAADDQATEQQKADEAEQPSEQPTEQESRENLEHVQAFLEQGREVAVVGARPHSGEKDAWIIAGTTTKADTGEAQPVAVRVGPDTLLHKKTGECVSQDILHRLNAGDTIVVDGKKKKHDVILARRVILA